jgi:hypothetical protein
LLIPRTDLLVANVRVHPVEVFQLSYDGRPGASWNVAFGEFSCSGGWPVSPHHCISPQQIASSFSARCYLVNLASMLGGIVCFASWVGQTPPNGVALVQLPACPAVRFNGSARLAL